VGRVCVDMDPITRLYGWCWCEGDKLVCVEANDEIVDDALRRGVPWCRKDF